MVKHSQSNHTGCCRNTDTPTLMVEDKGDEEEGATLQPLLHSVYS